MSKVLVTESYLTDIGNAIRAKNGGTTKYKPSEMAAAIKSLTTGSSSTPSAITPLSYVELKNQHIDTGITPEPSYVYEIKLNASSTVIDWYALFGCRVSSGDSKCFGITQVPNTAGQMRFDFDTTDTNGTSTQHNVSNALDKAEGTDFAFIGNGSSVYVKPSYLATPSYSFSKNSISASSTSGLTASIYLGAYHRQDTDSAIFVNPDIKLFAFTVCSGTTLTANFIPASYAGKDGMYETVKGSFHGVDGTITLPAFTDVTLTLYQGGRVSSATYHILVASQSPSTPKISYVDINNGSTKSIKLYTDKVYADCTVTFTTNTGASETVALTHNGNTMSGAITDTLFNYLLSCLSKSATLGIKVVS